MKRLEEELDLGNLHLKRFVFCPDTPDRIRAAAIHFHGQGDYSERYDETMETFTSRGIACVTTDLPGHGASEGKRGRIPGFDFIDEVARSNRERIRILCPEDRGPLGILGHSAGGLMALREMLLRPDPYSFSWISSPLVCPEANQNAILVRLAPVIACLVPNLTVGTGVTSDQCRHTQVDAQETAAEPADFFHARVSIGWGYDMIVAAREVRARLRSDPPVLPLLLTQGSADPICPPRYLREALADAKFPNLRYHEFPEALHEPFADTCKFEVFEKIAAWLDEVLGSADLAQTSPSG